VLILAPWLPGLLPIKKSCDRGGAWIADRNYSVSIGRRLEQCILPTLQPGSRTMSMETKSSAPSMDAEITADRDTILQSSFISFIVDDQRKTEDLLDALRNNRRRLQNQKIEYTKAVQVDGGIHSAISSKRRAIFHEIMRTYGAMEGLKDELTQRGANFDVDVNDHEHPNAAFKRLATTVKNPDVFGIMFWYLLISVVFLVLWFVTSDLWKQMWHIEQESSSSLRPRR
jgi:hypothetical protein